MTKIDGKLIAPCGINCAVCYAFLRKKKPCPGCLVSDFNKPNPCLACKTKLCAKKKEIIYCFQCEEFPCKTIRDLDKRYREHYHLSVVENLIFIKENGMEKFLERQNEKWKCPTCNKKICCHNGLCFDCDAEKLKTKRFKFRWED